MSRLFLAAIALLALLASGCGSASQRATPAEGSPAERPNRHVTVPDVVGLTEGEAVRALDAAGLVADVRTDRDLPRTATVDRVAPASGTDVDDHSVVLLYIADPPHPPPVAPEQEEEIGPLSRLVTDHPDVFVGLYHDEAGVVHVVFGPGADPAQWADRLREAASGITWPEEGVGYRADRCPRTLASLQAIEDDIWTTYQDWVEARHLGFGAWVHAETCTVRVEAHLRPAKIQEFVERYGTAISFDTSEGSQALLAIG